MIGFIIGLISITIQIFGLYSLQKRFPIQNFIDFSETTREILFHPTWDIMLMFFIVAVLFFYAISTGRGRITIIIISTYVAYAISSFLFLQKSFWGFTIPDGSIPKLVVFGSVFVLTLYFMFRTQIGSLIRSGMRDIAWWNALLQSIMEAGLLCSFLYTFLSPAEIRLLAPLTNFLVGTAGVQLGWIIAPFIWFAILNLIKRE